MKSITKAVTLMLLLSLFASHELVLADTKQSACRNLNIQLHNKSSDTITVMKIDYKKQNKWVQQRKVKKSMQPGGAWKISETLPAVNQVQTQLRVSFENAKGAQSMLSSPFKCKHSSEQSITLQ